MTSEANVEGAVRAGLRGVVFRGWTSSAGIWGREVRLRRVEDPRRWRLPRRPPGGRLGMPCRRWRSAVLTRSFAATPPFTLPARGARSAAPRTPTLPARRLGWVRWTCAHNTPAAASSEGRQPRKRGGASGGGERAGATRRVERLPQDACGRRPETHVLEQPKPDPLQSRSTLDSSRGIGGAGRLVSMSGGRDLARLYEQHAPAALRLAYVLTGDRKRRRGPGAGRVRADRRALRAAAQRLVVRRAYLRRTVVDLSDVRGAGSIGRAGA